MQQEILYFNFMPDFVDKYSSYVIEKASASGASQQAIDAQLQQMKSFKAMYDNPFINAAITFTEPFPIGLIVTLISAAILRKEDNCRNAMSQYGHEALHWREVSTTSP